MSTAPKTDALFKSLLDKFPPGLGDGKPYLIAYFHPAHVEAAKAFFGPAVKVFPTEPILINKPDAMSNVEQPAPRCDAQG